MITAATLPAEDAEERGGKPKGVFCGESTARKDVVI
jgi:hypothetical protein